MLPRNGFLSSLPYSQVDLPARARSYELYSFEKNPRVRKRKGEKKVEAREREEEIKKERNKQKETKTREGERKDRVRKNENIRKAEIEGEKKYGSFFFDEGRMG